MTDVVVSKAVTLENRRDELAYQLHCVEVKLQGELVGVAHQIAQGKFVPPEIALVLARNQFPDVDFLD